MFPLFIPIPIPINLGRRYNHYVQHQIQPINAANTGVMLGTLPNDFLRMPQSQVQTQEEADRATALHLQHQMMQPQQAVGRLQMTVVSAVLNKNYGMTRMDPYVRVRVGHYIYETQTDTNGAKTPRWSKVFHIYQFPKGVNTIHIEIYDERTLTDDELIAWVNLPIPETIFQGETVDEWYSLSGKMGEGQEGAVNVVLSYTTSPAMPHTFGPVMMVPPYAYSEYAHVPVYTLPPGQHPPGQQPPTSTPSPTRPISEEDIKQLEEMFPSVEAEVVKSVMEASQGDKEKAINSLLQMQDS